MKFIDKLRAISRRNHSLVCVGLDVDLDRIPPFFLKGDDPVFRFNQAIVDATRDLVCAYKPNLAFYQALGEEGIGALRRTIEYIPEEVPVILDAKWGDIGSTARMYARAAFDYYRADAVTLNPYLGEDSVLPFLEYEDRGVFLLCLTSNPGAADFQYYPADGVPLYQRVVEKALLWKGRGNCGLGVGATRPGELQRVRQMAPDLPLLIPGVGAQGGDVEYAVRHGTDSQGELAIINASRSIIYASPGEDFAQAAREATLRLREEINWWRGKTEGAP